MKVTKVTTSKRQASKPKLKREVYGGEVYEYYPLGKYIVAAPGVCGGRPTFKYTRLEVSMILALMTTGWTVDQIVHDYSDSRLTVGAVKEALRVANRILLKATKPLRKVA